MNPKTVVVLKYGGLCALCVVLLLVVYVVSSLLEGSSVHDLVPPAVRFYDPPATCSFPDKSFCATEQRFRQFVAVADVSSILENQEYVSYTCAPLQEEAPCIGNTGTLVIQVFSVEEGSNMQLLTRNDYIAYFRTFFAANGPFHFVYDAPVAHGASVVFMNHAKTESYRLLFQKVPNNWQFVAPQVTSLKGN